MPARRSIGAAEKVANILAAVCARPEGLSLTELAGVLGLDPGLLHRYLNTLTAARLLHRDHRSRLVTPGTALLAARQAAATHYSRQSSAFLAALHQLHGELHETLSVLRWTSKGPHAVWVKDSPDTLALTYRLGAVLPLLSTASGHVCLAYAPPDEVRALLSLEWPRQRAEQGPILNRWSVQDLVAEIRRRLARSRNYLHRVSALSTPLFDLEHRFWGVLTVLGPSPRFAYGWRGPNARGLHAFGQAQAVPDNFVEGLRAMQSAEERYP
ncbi:MAG: helix-turn-helix domain-containing protein [Pigmentiphaga sp.]